MNRFEAKPMCRHRKMHKVEHYWQVEVSALVVISILHGVSDFPSFFFFFFPICRCEQRLHLQPSPQTAYLQTTDCDYAACALHVRNINKPPTIYANWIVTRILWNQCQPFSLPVPGTLWNWKTLPKERTFSSEYSISQDLPRRSYVIDSLCETSFF